MNSRDSAASAAGVCGRTVRPGEAASAKGEPIHLAFGRVLAPKPEYPPRRDGRPHDWQSRLAHILRAEGHTKAKGGAPASNRTVEVRREALFGIFRLLREGGYKLEDPSNIDARHMRFVLKEWQRRRALHDAKKPGGLAPASVANLASVFRVFCRWIGQPQLAEYLHSGDASLTGRTRATTRDLTWEGVGIDALDIIERAWAYEPWVSVVLLLQFTLGLRDREAVMFRPDIAFPPGANVVSINVWRRPSPGLLGKISAGSKGGRPRAIVVRAPWEIAVLEFARAFVQVEQGTDGHVGAAGHRLDQNLRVYSRVLTRLGVTRADAGVTGHGLRAAFAVRELHRHGLEAPVRGGDLMAVDSAKRDLILRAVSEQLGHSRASISSAYYGSASQRGEVKKYEGNPDEILGPRVMALLQTLQGKLKQRRAGERLVNRYRKQLGAR